MKWKLFVSTAACALVVCGIQGKLAQAADCEITAIDGDKVTITCEPAEIEKFKPGKKVKVSK